MWTIDAERDALWLAIAFPGALVNLTNGQNGFLTLGLLGAALLTLERRPLVAGVMFGLMAYKPQYGLLVPIFLIATGRWRAIAAASVTVALLAALSLALFGAQTWQAFFTSITFTRHVVLEQGGSGFEKLQSAFAAARLWGFGVATAYVVQAIVSLITALAVIWIWLRTAKFDLQAAALATGVLLTTPYMMDYDLVLLAMPIAWLALEGRRSGFMPWEKSLLAFVWLLPLFARSLAGYALIPVAPLAMLLLIADIARRAAAVNVPPCRESGGYGLGWIRQQVARTFVEDAHHLAFADAQRLRVAVGDRVAQRFGYQQLRKHPRPSRHRRAACAEEPSHGLDLTRARRDPRRMHAIIGGARVRAGSRERSATCDGARARRG